MFRSLLSWKNAWGVRIFALSFLVLVLGIGSQVLVNAVAAGSGGTDADTLLLHVSAYATNGRMADGNLTHDGACAVSLSQFSFGTLIDLYNPDGSFNRECVAEDTNPAIQDGHIAIAMPTDDVSAMRWGVRDLLAQVARSGWGQQPPPIIGPIAPSHSTHKPKMRMRHFPASFYY